VSAPELHADEPRDAEEPDDVGAGFVSGVRQPDEEGDGYEMDDFDGEENGPKPPLPNLVPKPPAPLPIGFSAPPGEHVAGYDRQALPLRSPLAELRVTSRRYDEADAAVDDALDRAVAEALGVPLAHAAPAKPSGRPQSAAVARSQHAPSSANTALLSAAEPSVYGAVFAAQGAAAHACAHHGAEHAQGEQLLMAAHACAHHGAEQLVQATPAPQGRDRRARPASAHPHGRVGKAQRGGGRLSNADRERAEAAAAYLAPLEEDTHPPYAPQPSHSHAPQPAARAVVSASSARSGQGLTPAPPPPPPVYVPPASSATPDARLEQELRLLEHVYRPDVYGAPPAALQQAVAGRHRRDGERPPARAQSAGVAREGSGRDGGAGERVVAGGERVVAGGERDAVFTEFSELLPGPARRRRARSARTSSVPPAPVVDLRDEDGAGGGGGGGGMSGYLVGLRGAREEPSPYLAGMDSLLGGFPARFTTAMKGGVVQPVKIKDKRAQPGTGDMILYDQQLRILSSLYGTPIRGVIGVPPATDAAAIASGVAKFAKRQGARVAVGSGVAVAKAARFASPADL
jgi:hypothetical protein